MNYRQDEKLTKLGEGVRAKFHKERLDGLEIPTLLPGITINTSATDFRPIEQMQLQRFNGTTWALFGPIISGAVTD